MIAGPCLSPRVGKEKLVHSPYQLGMVLSLHMSSWLQSFYKRLLIRKGHACPVHNGIGAVMLSNKLAARLRKNWKKIGWWRTFLATVLFRLLYAKNEGSFILDERWDNLIILDACRFDVFEESLAKSKLEGKLESRISRGTDTPSFLKENFLKRDCKDIVYVSANPHVDLQTRGRFWKIVPVWKDDWNWKNGTVMPETVCKYALDAMKKYPDKRLIIHFLQPHSPYIGYQFDWSARERYNGPLTVFTTRTYAMIEKKSHLRLYRMNLEYAMECVQKLLANLPGITIVTADHGEAFGERIGPIRLYGHLHGARIPALVKVPWLVIENDKITRKRPRVAEKGAPPEAFDKQEEKEIQERLAALGYE